MKLSALICVCVLVSGSSAAGMETLYDAFLQKIVGDFNLRPLPTKPFEETEKFKLGRALFFDPILSGNRDIACATCHLHGAGTSDSLPFSIGTGGVGLGANRKPTPGNLKQPRNALDLWNRDNNAVKSMFWDGKVEVLDPIKRIFRSPLGSFLPTGLENLMAVQALFPLARADEMLGQAGDRSPADLPNMHADLDNELAFRTQAHVGPARIAAVLELIMEKRLLGRAGATLQPWQSAYRSLFRAAYPDVPIEKLTIVHVGNAISHYEEIAFATRQAPWDAYLTGDTGSISEVAKRGAFFFFGKGRCAVCHNGPLFSDFEYHAVGVKNYGPGIGQSGDDKGRYLVTGIATDKYKFRTPPLRNVTLTAPYFHNGSVKTLRNAITQHLDPFFYADKYEESGAFAMNVDQIGAISPVLARGVTLSEDDVDAIMAFLGTLEDDAHAHADQIIPSAVPSGLSVSAVRSRK